MTRSSARPVVAALLALFFSGCGGVDFGDLGPWWRGFELLRKTPPIDTRTMVVVVDDRAISEAVDLRADIGAGVDHVGGNDLGEFELLSPDPAVWHTVDLRVVLVPASSSSIDAVASPATNPALAWTTNQATREGRDAWVRAVYDEVKRMRAPLGAPFRPLERARDVFQLLKGQREATSDGEKAIVASFSSSRRRHVVGVSIVAASDDESPEDASAYLLDDRDEVQANVVTREGRGREDPDPARFPRLSAWDTGAGPGSFGGCHDDVDRPLYLFTPGCIDYWTRCDARPIEETSPGIGRCYIEITTVDPPRCDATRGWADPKRADGVRRPRTNANGEQVCEVLPVAAEFMDACVHDPICADCGNGWCLSEVRPYAQYCPASPPKMLRWIGGMVPAPGSMRVTCIEPE
jgi:hypothetical protein